MSDYVYTDINDSTKRVRPKGDIQGRQEIYGQTQIVKSDGTTVIDDFGSPDSPSINRSGTITTGGTAQNIPLTAALVAVYVQNPSDATESLWLNWGVSVTATTATPSIELPAGTGVSLTVDGTTQNLSVIAATTGHRFVAVEG